MLVLGKTLLEIGLGAFILQSVLAAPLDPLNAEVSPRAALNGCYGNGPTFGQAGFQDGSFIVKACNSVFANFYSAGGVRSTCVPGNPGQSVFMSVTRFGGTGGGTLSKQDCSAGFTIEFNACSHGSEQDHSGYHYRIDPNDVNC